MNEEEECIEMLLMACINFEKPSEMSGKDMWISVLARRVVFIEETNRSILDRNTSHELAATRRMILEELNVISLPDCIIGVQS
jgi:hypothetical protein